MTNYQQQEEGALPEKKRTVAKSDYLVIARRYRPQKFSDVVAQDPIVTTLKNAIKHERLAHAYLFSGSRGTGKTTLARIFAKALNCRSLSPEYEPCGECSSCKEIAAGSSLEVLEIDGASHRGIDDIRQINETVGYSTASGSYKIFIIDEVHMLTKEAFNALLKTLEEPPSHVKFFFATTEPHKVLPTILSRCQRFNLSRIPLEEIVDKLTAIASDLKITTDKAALRMIAERADGGLRDAESLLDQIYSFHGAEISKETVAAVLGIMPRDILFELDKAGKEGRLSIAFEIAHQVFSGGKDLVHFVETVTEHFRNILLIKIAGKEAPFLTLSQEEIERYAASAQLYSHEQCMSILDYLVEAQGQIRFSPSGRVALETILLHIMRSHRRIPIEVLVRRLAELEHSVASPAHHHAPTTPTEQNIPPPTALPPSEEASHRDKPPEQPIVTPPIALPPSKETVHRDREPPQQPIATPPPAPKPEPPQAPPSQQPPPPTPQQPIATPPPAPKPQPPPAATREKGVTKSKNRVESQTVDASKLKEQYHYDTLMQFAAVELQGNLEKKQIKRA